MTVNNNVLKLLHLKTFLRFVDCLNDLVMFENDNLVSSLSCFPELELGLFDNGPCKVVCRDRPQVPPVDPIRDESSRRFEIPSLVTLASQKAGAVNDETRKTEFFDRVFAFTFDPRNEKH